MCNLHWYYNFWTALSQSESSNFFMYIISTVIILIAIKDYILIFTVIILLYYNSRECKCYTVKALHILPRVTVGYNCYM